jgi:hypothetical protein
MAGPTVLYHLLTASASAGPTSTPLEIQSPSSFWSPFLPYTTAHNNPSKSQPLPLATPLLQSHRYGTIPAKVRQPPARLSKPAHLLTPAAVQAAAVGINHRFSFPSSPPMTPLFVSPDGHHCSNWPVCPSKMTVLTNAPALVWAGWLASPLACCSPVRPAVGYHAFSLHCPCSPPQPHPHPHHALAGDQWGSRALEREEGGVVGRDRVRENRGSELAGKERAGQGLCIGGAREE